MVLEDILKLPADEQVKALQVKSVIIPDVETLKKQWNPKDHDVFDAAKRPNKTVKKATGTKDASGEDTFETASEPVSRIAVPFQRIIVNRAVGFLLGNPVKLKKFTNGDAQETLATMVEKTLDDNKTDYFNRKVARTVMSQCEAAELWYLVEDKEFWKSRLENTTNAIFKLRTKLLSPQNGDKLFPFFDDFGDMTAFSREYVTRENGKPVIHFDTWTAEKVIKREKLSEWAVTEEKNQLGKIPVVYYSQEEPEWETVQSMIDRYETKISNFGDTNDYFGSPMVKVIGKVLSLPGKSSTGKVIQIDAGGDADYMSWNHAPESEKIEFEIIEKMIYAMTQTPNISFEQMKSIGGDLSGFAIKLMFTDAHLKAENKIELFGEMFQRRLNLLKHILGTVINVKLATEVPNTNIEPVFTPYLPKNVKEDIEILSTARAGKSLISNETAIGNNPLVGDIQEEIKRMKADSDEDMANAQKEFTGTF